MREGSIDDEMYSLMMMLLGGGGRGGDPPRGGISLLARRGLHVVGGEEGIPPKRPAMQGSKEPI